MRRLLAALQIFSSSALTWSAAWEQAKPVGQYQVEARDGELWIRPTPAPKVHA